MKFRWALVDIETTGLHVTQDKIIEISVLVITETGIEKLWTSLVNPVRPIPDSISQLTGISNASVANAPCFQVIANELWDLLNGCVLVAHNARFDYGFLKNAFKSVDMSFQMPVLCTIKLFRKLYPSLKKYNPGALATAFSLASSGAHRTEDDVKLLYEIIKRAFTDFPLETIESVAKAIYKKSSIPSSLKTDIDTIPDSPGVYLFYGAHSDIPLYIGKSIHLRQRVLSHFQADFAHPREFTLALQVERIEIIPTAGEFSALLLESALIKEKMPLYNRRLRRKKQVVGFKVIAIQDYSHLMITRELVEEDESNSEIFGTFRSLTAARQVLLSLVKTYNLCSKYCGLESGKGACFSYQLKRCEGACISKESSMSYNARVFEALAQFRQESWPFKGPIAIRESNEVNQLSQYLVFNQWRPLGLAQDVASALTLAKQPLPASEFDSYKILVSFLKTKPVETELIELELS